LHFARLLLLSLSLSLFLSLSFSFLVRPPPLSLAALFSPIRGGPILARRRPTACPIARMNKDEGGFTVERETEGIAGVRARGILQKANGLK
jgi:hypothetical protein